MSEPVNFDVFVMKKLEQLDKEDQKRNSLRDQIEGCDQQEEQKKRLMELNDLCQQYGLEDKINNGKPMSSHQLVT